MANAVVEFVQSSNISFQGFFTQHITCTQSSI
jgi:hypothetical protein